MAGWPTLSRQAARAGPGGSRLPASPAAQAGGNYIVQDIGGGYYAFYAHLQPGSLRFQVVPYEFTRFIGEGVVTNLNEVLTGAPCSTRRPGGPAPAGRCPSTNKW
jgi:hypothetical protein